MNIFPIKRVLVVSTNSIVIQLVRYTIVGGLAFIVDFASLFALTEFFSVHYLISAAIAFLLGITTNYVLSLTWVFTKRAITAFRIIQ
jgi:putative flippase GtrA